MDSIIQNYQDSFDFDLLKSMSVYVLCGHKNGFKEYNEGLVGSDETHAYSSGSGFAIFNDGTYSLVVASGHVVQEASDDNNFTVFVDFCDQKNTIPQEAFVLGKIHEDLALLVTRCGRTRHCLDISVKSNLNVGMPVYMSSYAGGNGCNTCTTGQLCCPKVKGVLLTANPPASSFIKFWIGGDEGSSGAAVVDDGMRLVAILSGSSMNDIRIDSEHASKLAEYKLKAPGDFKYGVNANKLRIIVEQLTSTLPLDASIKVRLAHIVKSIREMLGSGYGDELGGTPSN